MGLMPPQAAVGIGWPSVDVHRAPVLDAGDHPGFEARPLAYIGAAARNTNDGIVVDQRAQLTR